jgi:enamine deaminase RidA (YjgF/YER057c/UK114 family)
MTQTNTPPSTRLDLANQFAQAHGMDLLAPLVIGGQYVSAVEHQGVVHVSGQIPRIGTTVVATGRVGEAVNLKEAQTAAEVCTLRALAILQQQFGLHRIARVLKLNVYVQSAADFTHHSEVADAASHVLATVFGSEGLHARTSVGVYQLPKNAAVELDVTVALIR